MRNLTLAAIITGCVLLAGGPAAASTFCGCNGEVVLSLEEVATEAEGLVLVDVTATLDHVTEVEGPGGVFLFLGGFEMELRISGAKALAVQKSILIPYRDFASRPTQCLVGTSPGEKIVGAPLPLVRWRVTFQGEVADVRFDLDPDGLLSCERTEGCDGCGATCLYVGTMDAHQEGYIFGAGCVPAVLNPTGKPDLTPAPCTLSFSDVGVYAVRD